MHLQKFSHDIEKVKLIFMSIQRCQTTSKESKDGNISKSQGCIKKIPLCKRGKQSECPDLLRYYISEALN